MFCASLDAMFIFLDVSLLLLDPLDNRPISYIRRHKLVSVSLALYASQRSRAYASFDVSHRESWLIVKRLTIVCNVPAALARVVQYCLK